mmetsp:Transcript_23988/g.49608  ORF Transcript_23988/g.49608 Transcript_23988/m.49608 type:complete len:226 (+) Transcript_23988:136-813(+)
MKRLRLRSKKRYASFLRPRADINMRRALPERLARLPERVEREVVRVLAEHGNSHGTDAAGHRRDIRALRGALVKIHVALHHIFFHLSTFRFFLGVLVLDAVDPDINHDGPRFNPVPANVLSFAHRGDYDVRVPALLGCIFRAGVAACDGAVHRLQQRADRHADDVRPPKHHAVLPADRDVVPLQQLNAAGRSARDGQWRVATREPHVANVEGVEPIGVLFDGDGL